VKTEKASVNLSPVELGQIDYLVERGLFDNRSDFIRTATRKALEGYSDEFKRFADPDVEKDAGTSYHISVGISAISKTVFSDMMSSGGKIHIRAIGLLSIPTSVTADEIAATVKSCKVHGKLVASKEVKEALNNIDVE